MFALGCFSTIKAQNTSENGDRSTRIGFKFSPNFCWTKINVGNFTNEGAALGLSYGIMADFHFKPEYALSTELLVTSVTTKIQSNDTLYNSSITGSPVPYASPSFKYNLQYLQIPIMLKMKTKEIGNMKYWVQFGLAPGFLIGSKASTKTSPTLYASGSQSHQPNADANNKFDFAGDNGKGIYLDNVSVIRMPLAIGLGVEYNISGNTSLVAGIRFDNSFVDYLRDENVEARSNFLALHIGVFF